MRYLADTLSAGNLVAGIAGVVMALHGVPELALLCMMIGVLFDGFDGLAARRFGSTKLGVYADDIADGVNFGLVPAAALAVVIGGAEGLLLGGLYAVLTFGRLVHFTLNHGDGDPGWFGGLPSPAAAVMVLSATILFGAHPALLGLIVGMASWQMVSFDTRYRHVGRRMAADRRLQGLGMAFAISLAVIAMTAGARPAAMVLLSMTMAYGCLPPVSRLVGSLTNRQIA